MHSFGRLFGRNHAVHLLSVKGPVRPEVYAYSISHTSRKRYIELRLAYFEEWGLSAPRNGGPPPAKAGGDCQNDWHGGPVL